MSVKVMSAVWERDDLDASERLVMLSLADHADDEGVCYPSIARLCKRTSMSDRGIQKVLSRLIDRGFLSVKVGAGRSGSNRYFVNANPEPCSPPNPVHPEPGSPPPPNPVRKTPEPRSPKPSRTINEPSDSNARAALCSVLPDHIADAFIDHRKAKRAKLTDHAAQLIARKLGECPDPVAAVELSIMNGWTGVFPDRSRSGIPDPAPFKPDFSKFGVPQ